MVTMEEYMKILIFYVLIIISLFIVGCGGGSSNVDSYIGGTSLSIKTAPLAIKANIINERFTNPAPAKGSKQYIYPDILESDAKILFTIWDIKEITSNPAPKKNSPNIPFNPNLPEYNQEFTDGIYKFIYKGGAYTDFSAHSATIEALVSENSYYYIFSYVFLPIYDTSEAIYYWEPVYAGISTIEVHATRTTTKEIDLYEFYEEDLSYMLESVGLPENLNYQIAMNPGILGELPEIISLYAYKSNIDEPTIFFAPNDTLKILINMDFPIIIDSNYIYTIEINITHENTVFNKAITLKPNTNLTTLIAYDSNNNQINDFTLSSDHTKLYFNPTPVNYSILFNSDSSLKTGEVNFEFTFSSSKSEEKNLKYLTIFVDPEYSEYAPLTYTLFSNNALIYLYSDKVFNIVGTLDNISQYEVTLDNFCNIYAFEDRKILEIGSSLSENDIPTIADVDSNGVNNILPEIGYFYAFIPSFITGNYSSNTNAASIFQVLSVNKENYPYNIKISFYNNVYLDTASLEGLGPISSFILSSNDAYFPKVKDVGGNTIASAHKIKKDIFNTKWYDFYVDGNLNILANTSDNIQRKILNLGPILPENNLPTISDVNSNGSQSITPIAGNFYAFVPVTSDGTSSSDYAPIFYVSDKSSSNITINILDNYYSPSFYKHFQDNIIESLSFTSSDYISAFTIDHSISDYNLIFAVSNVGHYYLKRYDVLTDSLQDGYINISANYTAEINGIAAANEYIFIACESKVYKFPYDSTMFDNTSNVFNISTETSIIDLSSHEILSMDTLSNTLFILYRTLNDDKYYINSYDFNGQLNSTTFQLPNDLHNLSKLACTSDENGELYSFLISNYEYDNSNIYEIKNTNYNLMYTTSEIIEALEFDTRINPVNDVTSPFFIYTVSNNILHKIILDER